MSKYSNKEASGRRQRLSRVMHNTQADVTSEQLTIIDAKAQLKADVFERLNVTTTVNTQYLTLQKAT